MKRLPRASTATPQGEFNCAVDAAPPSPEYAASPFPATVVIVPPGVILRMRLPISERNVLPAATGATPGGLLSRADVAGRPSPESFDLPLRTTVEMVPSVPTLKSR